MTERDQVLKGLGRQFKTQRHVFGRVAAKMQTLSVGDLNRIADGKAAAYEPDLIRQAAEELGLPMTLIEKHLAVLSLPSVRREMRDGGVLRVAHA